MRLDNKKIISGVIWTVLGQIFFMAILLVSNILLARKLSPFEFGQIGIVMFFINLFNVLVESGFGGALVRKNNAGKKDFSTVFMFNLFVSVILFFLVLVLAKPVSIFYNDAQLYSITIAMGFIVLINSFQITQNAKLIKDLKFKQISIYKAVSIVVSSIIGISLAYCFDVGVWSIVIMQISNVFINTLLLNIFEESDYSFSFYKDSFQELYKFAVNTTLASIINTIFDNIYNLVIGKYFSISYAGFYYQGKKLQDVPNNLTNTLIHGVIYSSLSKLQDDKANFLALYSRFYKILISVTVMISAVFFLYSKEIVVIILGEKWSGSSIFIKYLSVISIFYLLEQYNRIIFKIYNKTNKILTLEIFKKIIQSFSILLGVIFSSVDFLMQGFLLTSIISYIVNVVVSRKIVNVTSNFEIALLIKTISIATIIVCLGKFLLIEANLNGFYVIFIILFLFLMSFKFFGIINFHQEFKLIKKIMKW